MIYSLHAVFDYKKPKNFNKFGKVSKIQRISTPKSKTEVLILQDTLGS